VSDDFEPPPEPAMIGGQGRDAEDVAEDGVSCLMIVVILAAVIAVGVWAAGGGR